MAPDAGPIRSAEEYRGRPPRAHPGRAWLWVPRVLLFPLYAVSEFAIRQPALAVGRWAEHTHAGSHVARAMHPVPGFSWGPSWDVDLGLRTSFGLAARLSDPGAPGATAALLARTGGSDVWYLAARGDLAAGPLRVGISSLFSERPDALLATAAAPEVPPARIHWARSDASAFVGVVAGPHVVLFGLGGIREDDTSAVRDFAAQHLPAGLGRVRTAYAGAYAALDTRDSPGRLQGVRLELGARYGVDPGAGPWRYVMGDAEVTGAIGVAGGRAALGAMAYVADASGVGGGVLPFTEMPTLGGDRFRGFLPGRFRGESAVAAEMQLNVEVGNDLTCVLAAGAGNAFGRHFEGFDAGALVGESWLAVRSRTDPRGSVEVLLGVGTRRFDPSFGIETVRLGVSLNRDLF